MTLQQFPVKKEKITTESTEDTEAAKRGMDVKNFFLSLFLNSVSSVLSVVIFSF
jgi:hypothetical protein